MRTPFVFQRIVKYRLTVEAESFEEAERKANELPAAPGPNVDVEPYKVVYVRGGDELFQCLRCGQPTARKIPDACGWDGSCSNCGMVAQSEVGNPAQKI